MTEMWVYIWDAVNAVVKPLARIVVSGTIVCFLSFAAVEFMLKPFAKGRANKNGTEVSASYLHLVAVFLAMGAMMVLHGNAPPNTPLSFGSGPAGWWMAGLAGFFGGAFAGSLSDAVKKFKWLNWLKKGK